MRLKTIVFVLFVFVVSGFSMFSEEPEDYYWEAISTPNKELNFSIMLLHQRYKWTESKTAGNYSTIPLSVKNKNNNKILKWPDYKIYILLDDFTLFHNYKTVAKKGDYCNNYTVKPGKIRYQMLCFGKKFNPDKIKKMYIKMTHSNFIEIRFFKGEVKKSEPKRTDSLNSDLDNEAKLVLNKFLEPNADYLTLTNALRPTEADYKAYFSNGSWKTAMNKYNQLWDKYPFAIKPNEGQTELLLWPATVEDIKYGTGNSSKFPGGYKMIADKIESGHIIYRFKFVKPGKTIGMAFDGLVKVNGRWVIFPKPWRIFQKK